MTIDLDIFGFLRFFFYRFTCFRKILEVTALIFVTTTSVIAQEIPSVLTGVDRGYVTDDSSFIAMRRATGLKFNALALTWNEDGTAKTDSFIMINPTVGQYIARIDDEQQVKLSRQANQNGNTYWGVREPGNFGAKQWGYGGLQGVTNSVDGTADNVIQTWERNPDSLVSLRSLQLFDEAFPSALSERSVAGVIVPSSEAGFFTSFLKSIKSNPQIRTSLDFSGNSIAAVAMSPNQTTAMANSVEGVKTQIALDFSSRNFFVDGLQTSFIQTPGIFDMFSRAGQLSAQDKSNFLSRFRDISPSRKCEVSRSATGAIGSGILSCEFHSSEHQTGSDTWVLMYLQFTALLVEPKQIALSYLTTFKYYKGSYESPPTADQYRSEETYRMNNEAKLSKRVGNSALQYVLNSL